MQIQPGIESGRCVRWRILLQLPLRIIFLEVSGRKQVGEPKKQRGFPVFFFGVIFTPHFLGKKKLDHKKFTTLTKSPLPFITGDPQMDLLTEAAEIFERKNRLPILPQDDQAFFCRFLKVEFWSNYSDLTRPHPER